jgi:hypothetical protein
MAVSRAKGALRAHSAQEGCETVGEALTPAEAEGRNGVGDCVLSNSDEDIAVW